MHNFNDSIHSINIYTALCAGVISGLGDKTREENCKNTVPPEDFFSFLLKILVEN